MEVIPGTVNIYSLSDMVIGQHVIGLNPISLVVLPDLAAYQVWFGLMSTKTAINSRVMTSTERGKITDLGNQIRIVAVYMIIY
jgi:hypothetical protein